MNLYRKLFYKSVGAEPAQAIRALSYSVNSFLLPAASVTLDPVRPWACLSQPFFEPDMILHPFSIRQRDVTPNFRTMSSAKVFLNARNQLNAGPDSHIGFVSSFLFMKRENKPKRFSKGISIPL